MNRVDLQADGQLHHSDRLIEKTPLRYLGSEVRLLPGCTLRSFFRCLTRYPDLAGLSPFLDSFLTYVAKCPESGCQCDGVDHLALWRTVEIIGHPPPPRMELTVSFGGYRDEERVDIRQYGLESLLDMPMTLGRLNHVVFGDTVNSMQFDTVFTLFELIDGISWQLSFHNMPAACRLIP